MSRIQFDTTTLSNGLLHKLTTNRASCIVFSNDNLLHKGIDHTQPLYITIGCLGHQVPYVLLDNGLTLNVCPISVIVALGFGLVDFSLSTQIVRAYDNTRKEVMRTLMLGIQVGLVTFFTLFQVLKVPMSFNMLLGRHWIHKVRAILSSFH